MKIETATIRRLRDTLLQSGRAPSMVLSSAYATLTRAGLLSPEEMAAVRKVEPVAEVMHLMMSVDGELDPAEKDAIRGAVRGLTRELLHSGTIDVMLESFGHKLSQQGREARLREVARAIADDPETTEAAFTLAAAVALADDRVVDAENELLRQLAEWLGLDDARAERLLDQLEAERRD